jgi:2-octaprenyl-6-methoxyphenol hydroxylase
MVGIKQFVMNKSCDILICGGGISGLLATAFFGISGYKVICVDPSLNDEASTTKNLDLRSTALLQQSIELMQKFNIWNDLIPYATPLYTMRIIDAGGENESPRTKRDFNSSEISGLPFGWNISNSVLKEELIKKIYTLSNVQLCFGVNSTKIVTRTSEAKVWLSNGKTVKAKLIIGADGKNSFVRKSLGIKSSSSNFKQSALAFIVNHPVSHQNISTEIHMSGGPFTLVPLNDNNGQHRSAVVWMEKTIRAKNLIDLNKDAFQDEVNKRSCGVLGNLTINSKTSLWPIVSQLSETFYSERTVLIAEAAHSSPPIGAQGLNMGMSDISTLLSLVEKNGLDSESAISEYSRLRRLKVNLRMKGIDALNLTSMAKMQWFKDLRSKSLGLIHDITPLRDQLMKYGMNAL